MGCWGQFLPPHPVELSPLKNVKTSAIILILLPFPEDHTSLLCFILLSTFLTHFCLNQRMDTFSADQIVSRRILTLIFNGTYS